MHDRNGDASVGDVFGRPFLAAIGLSDAALSIGGSVIVMLMAIRMVFPTQEGVFGQTPGGEPYIVPIAIPAIAGPSTLATIMMLAASEPNRLFEWGAVVVITCVVSFFVLASADWLERHMGEKLTLAFERLTGLLLAMMATQMFLGGVEAFWPNCRTESKEILTFSGRSSAKCVKSASLTGKCRRFAYPIVSTGAALKALSVEF